MEPQREPAEARNRVRRRASTDGQAGNQVDGGRVCSVVLLTAVGRPFVRQWHGRARQGTAGRAPPDGQK
jgi:hypothetical protein